MELQYQMLCRLKRKRKVGEISLLYSRTDFGYSTVLHDKVQQELKFQHIHPCTNWER